MNAPVSINVTSSGTLISFNLVQSAKANLQILFKFSGSVMLLSEVQSLKAYLLIFISLLFSAIFTCVSALQPSKAQSSICFTVSGISTF